MKHALFAAIGLVVLLTGCSTSSEASPEQYEELAKDVCKDAVRDVLKDPTSAEFDGTVATVVIDGEQWNVTGRVNANNSFGGKVGYQGFTCKATYTADDDTMRGSASLSSN